MPLSQMIRDPAVRAAFERAERDLGQAFTIPSPAPRPTLKGGAAEPHTDHRELELFA